MPNFATSSKIGPDFSKKLPKYDLYKKCAPKLIFLNKKREIQMVFDIQFECLIFALYDDVAKLGKASWHAYDPGEWLILLDLLKN